MKKDIIGRVTSVDKLARIDVTEKGNLLPAKNIYIVLARKEFISEVDA